MNEKEFKQNTFKVLGLIADIYYKKPELNSGIMSMTARLAVWWSKNSLVRKIVW